MAGIYIHIPFCEKKCIYCDFYSIENQNLISNFVDSLLIEIDIFKSQFKIDEKIETIFFGGGTPTLLSPNQYEKIINALKNNFSISSTAEVSTEANPGTVNIEKLKSLKQIGFNRISFGAQSFIEEELKFLSRIHSVNQISEAVDFARKAGFENLNLDLIFALPNQTIENWKFNLQSAINLNPEHISAYNLIVEPNTPLKNLVLSGNVKPLSNEIEAEFYSETISTLNNFGFNQYEISNFSKPNFECKHNLIYWNHSNYFSFGPSAHSFLKTETSAKRWWNYRNLEMYTSKIAGNSLPIAGSEVLSENELFTEKIFLDLRKGELNFSTIKSMYNKDLFSEHKNKLDFYLNENLIKIENNKLNLTKKGFAFCDEIATELISN